jgi:hypothetical protein
MKKWTVPVHANMWSPTARHELSQAEEEVDYADMNRRYPSAVKSQPK